MDFSMKILGTQCFESECGKAKAYVENDMPIGVFHDFLLELKGMMVDRMVEAHKEQLQRSEQQKSQDETPSLGEESGS